MKDLSLTRLLVLAFGAMTAIVLLVSVLAISLLAADRARFSAYVEGPASTERLIYEVRSAAEGRAIAARNLVLVTEAADRSREHEAVLREHDRMSKALGALRARAQADQSSTTEDRALLARLVAIEAQYGPLALAITQLALDGQRESAVAKMNGECLPLLASLVQAAADLTTHQHRRADQSARASDDANRREVALLLAVSVVAAAVAVVLGAVVSRSITRPVMQAAQVAQAVADGDLTSTVTTDRADEIGQLLRAMQRMSGKLAETVSGVRLAADGVRTSSREIAMGNQDLSQRTEQQASALQETAASMQQMTATVQHSADTAQQANQLAADANAAAAQGGEAVARVTATMEAISQSSARIADIIGTIDAIAFQTNILALNAAVEAARAGELGRGFAVVAGEVRNLARRSADAAKEVRSLIQASVERVNAGVSLVSEAGSAVAGIQAKVTRVADLLAEINSASQEQSDGISQVNQAVANIDEGTQQNAALVEQSAAAAESLRQQADALAQTIASFRTGDAVTS